MAGIYDSGLFSELGDLLGHDPTLYEESDVSSPTGDITKHSYSTSSLNNVNDITKVSELLSSTPVSSGSDAELDSLMFQGNMLLDQLMAENGLDLLTAPVELADVDELITTEAKLSSGPYDAPASDLFAQFYEPTSDTYQTPDSPVSTLPSEPSSPVDLFDLESAMSASAEPTSSPMVINDSSPSDELDDLLSSLLDEGHVPHSSDDYMDQFIASPTESSISDYSCYADNTDFSPNMEEDNSLSSYSCSPAPQKAKTAKKKKTSTPYSKLPANRKEKKKLQNKEAAIRYRQKKKNETQVLVDEETLLQERNDTLKAEVLNLEREIMCMKELLSDVFNIHSI